jgi:hypothetical protein
MKISKLLISFILSLSIFSSSMFADMVNTRELMHSTPKANVDSFLAKQEVQDKLAALGVSPSTIKERMASLTDDEIAQINQKIDEMPAGGDAGAIIGVLVFIFVLLLITDILGLTKVYSFTRPVR